MAKRTEGKLWEKLKVKARQMRHEATEAEEHLWQHLRDRKLGGLRFRRQHNIDRYIVDFYCDQYRLVIEVDGPIHESNWEADGVRQEYLEGLGLTVIRFSNDDVLQHTEQVLETILGHCTAYSDSPSLRSGEGVGG